MSTEVEVDVACSDAFRLFVDDLNAWWPSAYTWSQDTLQNIVVEGREGGRCYEVGPFDFRCDWGRVLRCEPGRSIVFTWQISPTRVPDPNPDHASEVVVAFIRVDDGTTFVRLTHRGFERHGDGSEAYAQAMGSEHGWPLILRLYAEHVGGSQGS